ncbi:MAG: MucR family transcriptional regulator [Hyphomicrobiales bacterium]|uniref:MucR family transcriptional regulator n=2 Tax=Pseudomonadota TaxID=1224 RepID=UPI0032658611
MTEAAERSSISATTLVGLTTDIVSAYVNNNYIAANELPVLIESVHATLSSACRTPPEPEVEELVPAVQIRKSITEDFLICLEDGRKFKSLKRHLRARYNLTPEEYRAKWGLPSDYPMVAPNYTASRSRIAKSMGLGRKRIKRSKA